MSQATASSTSPTLAGQRLTLCSPRSFAQKIDASGYSRHGITVDMTESGSLITTLTPWTHAWRAKHYTPAGEFGLPDYTYLSNVFTHLSQQMEARRLKTDLTKFGGGPRRSLMHNLKQAIVAAHQAAAPAPQVDESYRTKWHTIIEPGKIPEPLTFLLEEADDDELHDDDSSHDGQPHPLKWVVQMEPIPVDFTSLEIPPGAETVRMDIDLKYHPTIVATEEYSSVEGVGGRLGSSPAPHTWCEFYDDGSTEYLDDSSESEAPVADSIPSFHRRITGFSGRRYST